MSRITTHILDTSTGRPAAGVSVLLFRLEEGETLVGSGVTNPDGRISEGLNKEPLLAGHYKLRFETGPYFAEAARDAFYPYVEIVFAVVAAGHYHVPLLLSPFGFTTYRGS